jgi:hypothetical protein
MAPPGTLAEEFGSNIRFVCDLTRTPQEDDFEEGVNFVEEYQLARPAAAEEPLAEGATVAHS